MSKIQHKEVNQPSASRHHSAPTDKVKARNGKQTILRLWYYLIQQKRGLIAVMICVLITSLFGLISPYLIGLAIDQYMLSNDLTGLANISLALVAVFVVVSLSTWLQSMLMAPVAQSTVLALRKDLFASIQTQPLQFFDKHPHGDLMSRISNDVDTISNVLNESIVQLITAVITIIGVGIVMLKLNVWMALVSLTTIPLLILLSRIIAKHTRNGVRDQQRYLGELNSLIEESISGGRIVKAYGQEEVAINAFDKANLSLKTSAIRAQTMMVLPGPISGFLNNLTFAVIVTVGAMLVVSALATVGNIAAFIGYSRQFSRPVNQLANLYNTIQSAIAGAERVFELIDLAPDPTNIKNAPALPKIDGDVIFNNVCFAYEKNNPVLRNISLHALPGQTIAFVGPTGAGKTTIVNLLTRFYGIDEGEILIDGHNIHAVEKGSLRSQLGIVLQDTYLFSETVMDNIRYGRLDASDEQVIEAAKLADAHSFIALLPEGYNTQLSERAGNLSQGQRQLLAIARAMLADPAVLVLDEATSSIDTRTELKIQQALQRLMKGRTSFVIAHRLSTIREAEQVLVIDGGQVVERGTHEQLLIEEGFYHKLYMSQFKGQPLPTNRKTA